MAVGVDTTGSEIVSFYRDKTIFITGGTGFIGRVLVEHLIRKCEVKKIYMLVRGKKGVESKERKHTIFNVPLFDKLRSIKPNFMDSIEFVTGDMSELELGIDEITRGVLINEVQIVFHSAATVNLTGNLKTSTIINVRGTREMCTLCTEFKDLEGGPPDEQIENARQHHESAFVHVSTAYAHALQDEIGEVIYDVPIQPDDLIRIADSLTNDQIAGITENLICGWPNTYTFTKALAENMLKNYVGRMSMCVVRPGLVISTKNDPIDGWVDNVYGPIGLMAGGASGVLRVSNTDPLAKTEFVPADLLVNLLVAAGHHIGKQRTHSDIVIYNMVTAPDNPINYNEFNEISSGFAQTHPPSYTVWYMSHTCIKNRLLYLIAMFWVHLVPGFIVDGFLRLRGKQPRLMKTYSKIHTFLDSVSFVAVRSWNFGTTNTQRLRDRLNEVDRKYFDFDMSKSTLDWREMVRTAAHGTSKYIFNEDLTKVTDQTKRRYFWLCVCHRAVQGMSLVAGYWLLKITILSTVYLYTTALETSRHAICIN